MEQRETQGMEQDEGDGRMSEDSLWSDYDNDIAECGEVHDDSYCTKRENHTGAHYDSATHCEWEGGTDA
jgi:hypothetical protein